MVLKRDDKTRRAGHSSWELGIQFTFVWGVTVIVGKQIKPQCVLLLVYSRQRTISVFQEGTGLACLFIYIHCTTHEIYYSPDRSVMLKMWRVCQRVIVCVLCLSRLDEHLQLVLLLVWLVLDFYGARLFCHDEFCFQTHHALAEYRRCTSQLKRIYNLKTRVTNHVLL